MIGNFGASDWLIAALAAFAGFATLVHMLSIAVVGVAVRRGSRSSCSPPDSPAPVTVIRPIYEIDNFLQETLESTFLVSYPCFEVLLCAARPDDPAVAVARELIARYPKVDARLLIGSRRISQNPKLNNWARGAKEARHEVIAFVDCNVLMPPDYLWQMQANWQADTGIVSSPPVGAAPANFWAHVECAFLNSYHARWLLFANELNIAFAHGKNLMIRKSVLSQLGGVHALACEPAEDAAATKLVRRAGLQVHLNRRPFVQPLGQRSAREVWNRQVRWARLRRASFPLAFFPEVMAGSFLPFCASASAAYLAGVQPVLLLAAHAVLWFGSEMALARRAGWPLSYGTLLSMAIRDAGIPALWISAMASNRFEWRGHQMRTKPRLAQADEGE